IYSNAPMYFMQRITWSGVALHQGVVPSGPASHGCIRMPDAFAKQMWGITKLGARVIVTRGDVTPTPIANDRLFTIRQPPQPVPPAPQPEIAGPAPTEGTQPAPASTEVNQPAPASTELNQSASNAASSPAVATAPMPTPTPVALNVLAYDDGGAATKGKRKKT